MNPAHLARLRSLEAQLVPRHYDTEERQKVLDEIVQILSDEAERNRVPGAPEPSDAEIAEIEAILEERLAARGHVR